MKDPFSVCFSKYVLKENDHLTTFQNYDNLFKIPLVITFEEKFLSQCVFENIHLQIWILTSEEVVSKSGRRGGGVNLYLQ